MSKEQILSPKGHEILLENFYYRITRDLILLQNLVPIIKKLTPNIHELNIQKLSF